MPQRTRADVIREVDAMLWQLRQIVSALEQREAPDAARLAGDLDRLQARVGLLTEHEQERLVRRYLDEERIPCDEPSTYSRSFSR